MPRIMCHHHTISDSDREFMVGKVGRLKKYYERIQEVSIILDAEKRVSRAEILLWGPRLNLRVSDEAEDMRTAFESAINKAERWLRKAKERLWGDKMHRRHNVTIRRLTPAEFELAEPLEAALAEPVEIERLEPSVMSLDEARRQFDARGGLFVFVNSDTQEISILHRNRENHLELLEIGEPEALSQSEESIG